LLRDFGERHPDEPQLTAQASRIRLRALLEIADYEEAAREVDANRAVLAEEGRADAIAGLARAFAKQGRMSESREAGAAASRVALELYAIGEASGAEAPNPRQQIERAQLRESAGELDAAQADYERVLAINPKSLPALRGLAGIAEQRDDLSRSLSYWVEYTEAVKPGEVGWFRGQYEQARLSAALGRIDDTCERLRALRTAMPALQDERMLQRLRTLFAESGC
jgi:tetratricopeptide (TPR) repeat protein